MALDIFMKISTIEGESQDKTHAKEIDVLAWSWGVSNTGTAGQGGGSGAGKAHATDLSFTKYTDKSSPKLILASFAGTHFDTATLVLRKAGGTPLEYLTITLTQVLVTSVSTGGTSSDERLTENVTLNFGTVKVAYKEQDAKGAVKGGDITASWNVTQNVATG